MTAAGPAFAYTSLFSKHLPAPAARWNGLPKFNFAVGHNDPEQVPTDALAKAAADVIRRHGDRLAIYNLGQGGLGYEPLREFLRGKLEATRGISCTARTS